MVVGWHLLAKRPAISKAKDETVPLDESERMVRMIEQAGGDVQLTVYPEAEHDSWMATYANADLYEWLLSHSRHRYRLRFEKDGVAPRGRPKLLRASCRRLWMIGWWPDHSSSQVRMSAAPMA